GGFALLSAAALTEVVTRSVRSAPHADQRSDLPQLPTPRADARAMAALVPPARLAVLPGGVGPSGVVVAADPVPGPGPVLVGVGAGVLVAVAVGVAVYPLARTVRPHRFLLVANLFLVVVAAGLVSAGVRSAQELGWLTVGAGRWFDAAGAV